MRKMKKVKIIMKKKKNKKIKISLNLLNYINTNKLNII